MITRNGTTVAAGTRISNNLYQLDNFIAQLLANITEHKKNEIKEIALTCSAAADMPAQTWETWHRRFSHLARSSIKTLVDKGLVTGLNLDLGSCGGNTLSNPSMEISTITHSWMTVPANHTSPS
jgi:hypothetical protein